METNTATIDKPSNASARNAAPQITGNTTPLLSRADYGLHLTGRVEQVSELAHRSGVSQASGKAWEFYQQTVSLSIGGAMIDVNFRADTDPGKPLCSFELDSIVRLKVENPRIYAGKVSFDVCG